MAESSYNFLEYNNISIYLTSRFHWTLYAGGTASTVQSKYTSVPSRMSSARKLVPNVIWVSGTSENRLQMGFNYALLLKPIITNTCNIFQHKSVQDIIVTRNFRFQGFRRKIYFFIVYYILLNKIFFISLCLYFLLNWKIII